MKVRGPTAPPTEGRSVAAVIAATAGIAVLAVISEGAFPVGDPVVINSDPVNAPRAVRIAENSSPIPRNRFVFSSIHFHEAAMDYNVDLRRYDTFTKQFLDAVIRANILPPQTTPQHDPFLGADVFGALYTSRAVGGFDLDVLAAIFNDDGSPFAPQAVFNGPNLGGDQFSPAAALNRQNFLGGVYVAAQDADGDGRAIFARVFTIPAQASTLRTTATRATPVGDEFQVNTFTTGDQDYPSLVAGPDDNFLAVWQSAGQDGDSLGIVAQRFAQAGALIGTEFIVNTYTTGLQAKPAVAINTAGVMMVVWEDFSRDGSVTGVAGRIFDSSAVAIGEDFLINTYTTSPQFAPRVSIDAQDNFAVVWASLGQDGDSTGVFGRVIGPDGTPISSEFQVSTSSAGVQRAPDVAGPGSFVVAWEGDQDSGDSGVFAQVFETPGGPSGLCGDGNDSGEVSATDALIALKTGVGSESCAACVCDVDRSGAVLATDALLILQFGVGQPITLDCVSC